MSKVQSLKINTIALMLSIALVLFLKQEYLVALSLFCMGLFWVYFFHQRQKLYSRKFNRLSIFWLMSKAYKFFELIPKNSLREIVVIFTPFLAIVGLKNFLGSIQYEWLFLVGSIGYEIFYLIRKLLRPDQLNK